MHKVLIAIDESPVSEQAARLIAHLPHLDRLELTIVSVVPRPYVHSSYMTTDILESAFEREKELAVERYLHITSFFAGANADIRHVIREGNIGEAIVDVAKELKSDLVVVGATGHSQISRILLGSVSDHVATHAPCSVLVVRPTGLSESDRPIRVCLAFDDSGPAQAALEEISEVNWGNGAEFHVVYIAAYINEFFGSLTYAPEAVEQYETTLSLAKDQLKDFTPHLQTHLVESNHVGEGIVRFSEDHKIDLMVVGETVRSTLGRFLLGSTARYVLRHASCSVWITRNRVVHGIQKDQYQAPQFTAIPQN